jgi:hypothetical protein
LSWNEMTRKFHRSGLIVKRSEWRSLVRHPVAISSPLRSLSISVGGGLKPRETVEGIWGRGIAGG